MAWYVSLTMRWEDLEGDLEAFLSTCANAPVPSHHIRIHQRSWHSTVFAIAQINGFCDHFKSMHEAALAVLNELRDSDFPNALNSLPKFKLSPAAIQHFWNNSTIQFQTESEPLTKLRSTIANAVSNIKLNATGIEIEFPKHAPSKNAGDLLFGSFARNPSPTNPDTRQQKLDITSEFDALCFTATKLIFTISDDALTNVLDDHTDFDVVNLV